ncbi:MAG: alpha-L-fucosidase [candidate division KSB1 bacterium]|nr:alpha-L-fucosidase [candidate division KSB1 bacterium]
MLRGGQGAVGSLLLLWGLATVATGSVPEQARQTQDRTQWFRDAKYGMFIHWGVYAMLGRHEWVREMCHIPLAEYQYYVDNFNPVDFDPDEWVRLAEEAGMKYIVITSKHHDGFCIFDSKYTDYDIMHSKYGKDALGMLVKACKRRGMPIGFYYSIMDWHHPDYLPRRAWEKDRPAEGANFERYIEYMKNQLRELVEKYDPAILWFDGEWEHTVEEMHSFEIEEMLLKMKPTLLINDRLFKRTPGHGDFGTPENFVPATGVLGPDGRPLLWEACYTINWNSWGYNHYETEFHSATQLLRQLIEIVSKGGNLLLNVGPTPEGTIQPEFQARLRYIGRWLKANGEAIYGTTASLFPRLPFFGRCTVKGNTLYFHVMGWPQDGKLRVPGLKTEVRRAYLLVDRARSLPFTRDGGDVLIALPDRAPDPDATVVAVELVGPPEVEPYEIRPDRRGVIELPVYLGEIRARGGQRAYLDHFYKFTMLTNWQSVYDVPEWEFVTERPATYEVKVSYAATRGQEGTRYVVEIDNVQIPAEVKRSPSVFYPALFTVGTVDVEPGRHTLRVRLLDLRADFGMNLEKIVLIPVSGL